MGYTRRLVPRPEPRYDWPKAKRARGHYRCGVCGGIIARAEYYGHNGRCEGCLAAYHEEGQRVFGRGYKATKAKLVPDISIQLRRLRHGIG